MLRRLLTDWRSPIALAFLILGSWGTVYAFQRTFGEGMMIGLLCVFGAGILIWAVVSPD